MDINEIIEAWKVSNNPTPEQSELAQKRGEICKSCNHNTNILSVHVCGSCGCPINKKIFTQKFNPCPEKYWSEVDTPYFKTTKSLI